MQGDDASDETESLSKEELGRIVGSRWTGKKIDQESAEADSAVDDEYHEEQTKNTQDEEYNSYESDTEDEHSTYDDDEAEDHAEDLEEDASEATSSSYKYESDDDSDFTGLYMLLPKFHHLNISLDKLCINVLNIKLDKLFHYHMKFCLVNELYLSFNN